MKESDRKELVQLLQRTILFPHSGRQLLMAAFFNKAMTLTEAMELLGILREEKQEVDKNEQELQKEVAALKKKYNIKDE